MMSDITRDPIAGAVGDPQLRRPSWPVSAFIDGGFAVGAYLASYWLRFDSERLAAFLPGAWSTMPVVGAMRRGALAGAYARRPRVDWLSGSSLRRGNSARSRPDSLLGVLSRDSRGSRGRVRRRRGAAVDCRHRVAGRVGAESAGARSRLRARGGRRARRSRRGDDARPSSWEPLPLPELLKALVLKDLKLKYRGSVFGFLWSLANPLLMIVVYTLAFTFILGMRSEMFVFYLMLGPALLDVLRQLRMMSTASIVDNARPSEDRAVSARDSADRHGALQFAQYLLTIAVFLPVMMLWYRMPPSRR